MESSRYSTDFVAWLNTEAAIDDAEADDIETAWWIWRSARRPLLKELARLRRTCRAHGIDPGD